MFAGCRKLTTLDMSNCDIGNVSSTLFTFSSCYELTNLKAPKNIRCNMSLRYCEKLTHESLMSIINNLAIVTSGKTFTLGETNLAKLSEKEKAIATNKGWILE
jgi:surface protein